jgi:hypothetical protein
MSGKELTKGNMQDKRSASYLRRYLDEITNKKILLNLYSTKKNLLPTNYKFGLK